jgi:hypothetical protein
VLQLKKLWVISEIIIACFGVGDEHSSGSLPKNWVFCFLHVPTDIPNLTCNSQTICPDNHSWWSACWVSVQWLLPWLCLFLLYWSCYQWDLLPL